MCLAVPAKIVALEGTSATVDMHGNRVEISTLLTPEVKLGDWVLVHAGFSIQQLDAAAAAETFALMRDLGVAGGGAAGPPAPAAIGAAAPAAGGRHA